MYKTKLIPIIILIFTMSGCEQDQVIPSENCINENFFQDSGKRNFKMGFTSWPYAASTEAINKTYEFIKANSDINTEQIDNSIPWQSLINNTEFPEDFINNIALKVSKRNWNVEFLLSVSLLNIDRSDLAEDFDGSIPSYTSLNDKQIENAYFNYISYLMNTFVPDVLIISIESNELKIKSPDKWNAYKELMKSVKRRVKQLYPSVPISESITLHNLYKTEVANSEEYVNEIVNYANQMDFVAISYYPFFKGQHSKAEFQQAFDFLHSKITKPIAFSETGHLAENLSVESYNLTINGNPCEQNAYLETLFTNAQENDYKFVIWWTHRDFDALWETFPEETKDLGKLWRDTGLLDENGYKRVGYQTWENVLSH